MLKASAGKLLPTTITGSLPRPSWYTENLGNRSFLEAMVFTRFREPYTDALSIYMKAQHTSGLDIVTFAVQDSHYKDLPERIWAFSDAFNEELHDLADAGCQVIQMEEPQIHLLAARGAVQGAITPEFMLKVFNNTVKGLRAKTEVW